MMNNNVNIIYLQFGISIISLGIFGGLLIYDSSRSDILLPCMTAIIFSWLPSPISNNKNTQQIENKPVDVETVTAQ